MKHKYIKYIMYHEWEAVKTQAAGRRKHNTAGIRLFRHYVKKNPIFNRLKEIKRNMDEYRIRYTRNDETVLRNKCNF